MKFKKFYTIKAYPRWYAFNLNILYGEKDKNQYFFPFSAKDCARSLNLDFQTPVFEKQRTLFKSHHSIFFQYPTITEKVIHYNVDFVFIILR